MPFAAIMAAEVMAMNNQSLVVVKSRKRSFNPSTAVLLIFVLICFAAIFDVYKNRVPADVKVPDYVDVQLIDIDGEARRGLKLEAVNAIVIHYVGNPGTTAQENRDFFNRPETHVSSHFVIGLDGEIIQCVPLFEKSSASNDRNRDTISIEVCHPAEDGQFTEAAYASLIKLTAWLCETYHLDENDIIRHGDVIEKDCPKYYMEHPKAWLQLKSDVANAIK